MILCLDCRQPLSPHDGIRCPLIHRPPSALAVPSSAGWRPHTAAAPLSVKLRGDSAGVGACPGRSTGILRQDVDSFYAKVLTLCTKVLTQGCFDRIVSASRGESPRNSLAASSSLVGVDLVNVSTPWRKTPLCQGVNTPKQVTRSLAWSVERGSGVKACQTYGHVLRIRAWPCQHLRAKYHRPACRRARRAVSSPRADVRYCQWRPVTRDGARAAPTRP